MRRVKQNPLWMQQGEQPVVIKGVTEAARMSSLKTYLKETFKPRCVAHGEDEITAHRYAAKVELAQHIINQLEAPTQPEDEEELE